jgi:hypothetical protein
MSYLLRTTLPDDLATWLKRQAENEVRTEANMNEVLIREAKAMRETKKPKPKIGDSA